MAMNKNYSKSIHLSFLYEREELATTLDVYPKA